MLKEEDRKIEQKSNRSSNIIYVIENDYKNKDDGESIQIHNWEEIKSNIRKS